MMSRADNTAAAFGGRFVHSFGMPKSTRRRARNRPIRPQRVPRPDPASAYLRAFHERLRAARIAKDASQEDVGRILGIKGDTYRKYESERQLPARFIEPVCLFLEIPVDQLVAGRRVRIGDEE